MKKRRPIFIVALIMMLSSAYAQSFTYTNPVIYADYSDPDAIAAAEGNGYYMTASSFQCTPGLPILHSSDLVNWEIVNYALYAVPPADYYNVTSRHGKGVWAPSIRHHNGEYYIYWGDPDFGIYMVKTQDPKGKWSDPILVKEGKGFIDPVPFWDEDGKAYLAHAWAASRSKFNSVLTLWEMTSDGTSLVGSPKIIFDGNDGLNHTCEGPKIYKRNGLYYILCPAGGVDKGWQLALRSDNIWGPYESRNVMSQGSSDINGPHQGALVDAPNGKSWFLHFQELQPWGRVIHLNPVEWEGGWPMMGINNMPVRTYEYPTIPDKSKQMQRSDDFNDGKLGLQWQWHGNYQPYFGMVTANGIMRLYSHLQDKSFKNMWDVSNMLLQKFNGAPFNATAKTKVSARTDGTQSGLIVMGRDYCRLAVEKQGDQFVLKQIICLDAENGTSEETVSTIVLGEAYKYAAGAAPNYELPAWFRAQVNKNGVCRFSYSVDGQNYKTIGQSFKAREGKWIGAKIGFYSIAPESGDRGWIDIDNFIIQ